jgi:hypothetical protein
MAVTWKKLAYVDDVVTKAAYTTTGDIMVASSASTPARLGIGSTSDVLTVVGGTAAWAAPAGVASHALSAHTVATGNLLFGGYQATNQVLHTVADNTAKLALTPVVGKLVFQTDELAAYLCTVDA